MTNADILFLFAVSLTHNNTLMYGLQVRQSSVNVSFALTGEVWGVCGKWFHENWRSHNGPYCTIIQTFAVMTLGAGEFGSQVYISSIICEVAYVQKLDLTIYHLNIKYFM